MSEPDRFERGPIGPLGHLARSGNSTPPIRLRRHVRSRGKSARWVPVVPSALAQIGNWLEKRRTARLSRTSLSNPGLHLAQGFDTLRKFFIDAPESTIGKNCHHIARS